MAKKLHITKRTLNSLIVLLLFIIIAAIFLTKKSQKDIVNNPAPNTPTLSPTPTPIREKMKVTRVIDGDTIVLSNNEQVRYIGIDAPESDTNDCFTADSTETNSSLVLNQEVELESDVNDKDNYKRLLRYVYVDGEMVNEFLVRWGYAKAENYFPEKRYRELFLEAEKEAKEQKRGLWGKCN